MTKIAYLSGGLAKAYTCVVRGLRQASFAAVSVVLMCLAASASIRVISIEKSFARADAVLLVQIETTDSLSHAGSQCAIRYSGKVLQRFKSTEKVGNEIQFGRTEGLTIGKRYLLFLEYVSSAEQEYDRASEHPEDVKDPAKKAEVLDFVSCEGTVPGFLFDPGIAWVLDRNSVRISGIRPVELLEGAIRHVADGDLEWRVPTDALFAYLRHSESSRPR